MIPAALRGAAAGTVLSIQLTEPLVYDGLVVVSKDVSSDTQTDVSLLLPLLQPVGVEEHHLPITALISVRSTGCIPVHSSSPWNSGKFRRLLPGELRRITQLAKQRLQHRLHHRSQVEWDIVSQCLKWAILLDSTALVDNLLDRLFFLEQLGQGVTLEAAVFLYDCAHALRHQDSPRPQHHHSAFRSVPERLRYALSFDPLIRPDSLDLPVLCNFGNYQWFDREILCAQLDALLLHETRPKKRTLNNYLFFKDLLGHLLSLGDANPNLWSTFPFQSLGNILLHEILILERLVVTGLTQRAEELRKMIYKIAPLPGDFQEAYPGCPAHSQLLDVYQKENFLPRYGDAHYDGKPVAFTALDYFLWSACFSVRRNGVHGACHPEGNRYSILTKEHPYFEFCSKKSEEPASEADVQFGTPEEPEPLPAILFDLRSEKKSWENTDHRPPPSNNPLDKLDIRTCHSWMNRPFTEKVQFVEPLEYDHGGGAHAKCQGSLSGLSTETTSTVAGTRRWLPYFVEDFYNLNYHMFMDFSDWIKPHRSNTLQGDLAPITSNIINLEKLEALDPSLTPLYNLLRHEHCFDALTDPSKVTTVKDRVRLSSGQLAQAIDWTIIEELTHRPTKGMPVGLFTVPKKDPSLLRLIVDGRPWNQTQFRPEPMPIPRLLDTIRAVQGMNFAVQYDGVSFFYQFPTRHSRFHFRKRGSWHRFCRMPMGWSYGPLIAQRTANAILAETVKRLGKRVVNSNIYTACWVDNFLLAAKSEKDLKVLEAEFLKVAEEVSLEVKKEEQVDLQHTTFAGIEHDLLLHQYRPRMSPHIVEDFDAVRDVMKACGCCIWQLYSRSKQLCFYDHLLATVGRLCTPAMRGDCSWDAKLDRYLRKGDLEVLQQLVTHAKDQSWQSTPPPHALVDSAVWFDASGYEWAFISDESQGGQGVFRSPEQLHIFVKEGTAFLAAVAATAHQFPGRRRIFYTDNQPLAKAFRKGHSSNGAVNSILRRVITILREHDAEIELVWIPTDTNKSDKYTRGHRLSMSNKFRKLVEAEHLVACHSRRLLRV